MVSYDSDSSGEEDQEFTETNVLLGYTSKDAGGETVSRLGGRPDWLVPDKPSTAALARCKVCKDLMVLLLQLNGELPERFPGHERRIYVFSCRRKSCRRKVGSIRAVRGLRMSSAAAAAGDKAAAEPAKAAAPPVKEEPKPVTSTGLGESLFGVKPAAGASGSANPFAGANPFATKPPSQTPAANPFSTQPQPQLPTEEASQAPEKADDKTAAAAETAASELPKTFAEKLALNNPQAAGPPPPPEPWPAESDPQQPAPYPVSWIAEAEYETLDPTPMPRVPTGPTAMELDESSAGGAGGSGKEDKVVFESSMDAAFQKFADRVGQNPDQVIRYEYGGVPLLYSRDDDVGRMLGGGGEGAAGVSRAKVGASGMSPCANCGAPRVFEMQLMPQAIADLESGRDEGLDGMDWGTVIVGVCSRDCQDRFVADGEAGYLEEWAGVQWEELVVTR